MKKKLTSVILFLALSAGVVSAQTSKVTGKVIGEDGEGSPDKPGGLSIQLCKSEKKEFYIRYSS